MNKCLNCHKTTLDLMNELCFQCRNKDRGDGDFPGVVDDDEGDFPFHEPVVSREKPDPRINCPLDPGEGYRIINHYKETWQEGDEFYQFDQWRKTDGEFSPEPGAIFYHRRAISKPTTVNDIQHGGDHYKTSRIEPWDYIAANELDFFQGSIVKYVSRFRDKNGLDDLKKAGHFLDKLIEIEYGSDEGN